MNFFKNKFIKNVLLVASGTAGAQAIGILIMPFITRLYGPESFGVFGVFTAIASAIMPVAALTYPVAIVLAQSDQEAKEIGAMSIMISCVLATIALLIIFITKNTLSANLNIKTIGSFLYLIPFVMIFSATLQVARQWAIRNQNYKRIAHTSIIQSLAMNGSKLSIGLVYPSAIVLIIVYILGQLLQASLLLSKDTSLFIRQLFLLSHNRFKELAKKYYDFPLYRAPQVALNAFSESIPIIFFAFFYGTATAGYYSLARVALGIPTTLIGQSVNDVFYPRFISAAKEGLSQRALLLKASIGLMVIGTIPYSLLFIIGPWAFSFIFGSEWVMAGEFSRWLSFWLFATLFTRPIIAAIPALKMQPFLLGFEVFALIIRTGSIYLGYLYFSSAIASVALLGGLNLLIYTILLLSVISNTKP